jgi:hypothetical protein
MANATTTQTHGKRTCCSFFPAQWQDLCNTATRNRNKDGCSRNVSYEWWGIWYSFFLSLTVLALTVRNFRKEGEGSKGWPECLRATSDLSASTQVLGRVEGWVSTLQALAAACMSVTMINCNRWAERAGVMGPHALLLRRASVACATPCPGAEAMSDWVHRWINASAGSVGDYESASQAALAGFVIASIGLALLIIFLGRMGVGRPSSGSRGAGQQALITRSDFAGLLRVPASLLAGLAGAGVEVSLAVKAVRPARTVDEPKPVAVKSAAAESA